MRKLFYNFDYIISLNPLQFFQALTILDGDSTKGLINSFKTHSIFLPQGANTCFCIHLFVHVIVFIQKPVWDK